MTYTMTPATGVYTLTVAEAMLRTMRSGTVINIYAPTGRSTQKLYKKVVSDISFTVDFSAVLDGATIATLLSVTNDSLTFDETDIDPNGRRIHLTVSGGSNNTEYEISIVLTDTNGQTIDISVILIAANITIDYYGTVADANDYFAFHTQGSVWSDLSDTMKLIGLVQATRGIDCLSFYGSKADANQPLQFPRGADVIEPVAIDRATYEEALLLTQGDTVDEAINDLSISSERIDTAIVHYMPNWGLTSVQSGILSSVAWHLLEPYLSSTLGIKVLRVN